MKNNEIFYLFDKRLKGIILLGKNKSNTMASTVIIEYRFVYGSSAETEHYTFTIFSEGIGAPAKMLLLFWQLSGNHTGRQLCQNFRE